MFTTLQIIIDIFESSHELYCSQFINLRRCLAEDGGKMFSENTILNVLVRKISLNWILSLKNIRTKTI